MKLSLIIPVFKNDNGLNILLKSISSLRHKQHLADIHIVGDGYQPTVSFSFNLNSKLNIHSYEQNQGPSFARNYGARLAQGQLLWFLDSDTEIESIDIIPKILHVFSSDENIAASGGYFEMFNETKSYFLPQLFINFHPMFTLEKNSKISKEVSFLSSTNLICRSEIFEKISFDESLTIYEDLDICLKMRKLGKKVFFSSDISITHLKNQHSQGVFQYRKKLKDLTRTQIQSRFYLQKVHKHSDSKLLFFIYEWLFYFQFLIRSRNLVKESTNDKDKNKIFAVFILNIIELTKFIFLSTIKK